MTTQDRRATQARDDAAAMSRRADRREKAGDTQAAHYWRVQAEQARAQADRLERAR